MGILTYIITALKAKEALFKTVSTSKDWVKHKAETFELGDIKTISDTFFDDKIGYGNYVIGTGYFSEYAHTYMPDTYMPRLWAKGFDKVVGQTQVPQGTKLDMRTTLKFSVFPFPIEALPNTNTLNGLVRLGFIYPSNFSGFIHETDQEGENSISLEAISLLPIATPIHRLPEKAKPIPVLFPVGDYSRLLGRMVRFKAKVIEIPFDYLQTLTANLGEFSREVFSNAFRPFNRGKRTLCLSLVDDKAEFRQATDISLSHIRGSLFLEGHLENYIPTNETNDIIAGVIPERLKFPMAINYAPYNDFSPIITKGKIRVIWRKPNIFGFYIETDLSNSELYSKDLEDLYKYFRATDRNIQNALTSNGHPRYKLKLDFVFDYNLRSYFDSRGILNSDEVENILKNNPDLRTTREWLNGLS